METTRISKSIDAYNDGKLVDVSLNVDYQDDQQTRGKANEIEAALSDCLDKIKSIIYPG